MNTALHSLSSIYQPVLASTLRWQEPLATRLRYRHDLPGQLANRLLNVELGLFVLAELLPLAPAEALPDLLNGQGAVYRERPIWTPRQHRYLKQARALLAPYQDRTLWFQALRRYEGLPAYLRAFRLDGGWNAEAGAQTLRERLAILRGALD